MPGGLLAVWFGNVAGARCCSTPSGGATARSVSSAVSRAGTRRARTPDCAPSSTAMGYPRSSSAGSSPGVRAIVPPFAGALRLSPTWTRSMIATASAIWYGLITVHRLSRRRGLGAAHGATVTRYSTAIGIAAAVIARRRHRWWIIVRRRRREGRERGPATSRRSSSSASATFSRWSRASSPRTQEAYGRDLARFVDYALDPGRRRAA